MDACARRWWAVAISILPALVSSGTLRAAESEQKTEPALDLEFYGYIKLDAAWDEALIDPGNFARWVASPSVIEEHSHFNVTARQTRLGVNLSREPDDGLTIDAKVEIDFHGGGAENKNRPQLRHAYVDLGWADRGLLLRAGQASDVISPLVPTTLNYTVAWWAGNIGYRRPLAALTKTFGAEDRSHTKLTAAISRSIGDDFGAVEPGDSGADSGKPTFQTALWTSFTMAEKPARLGLSGHWGQENLREQREDPRLEAESWSLNLDFVLPLGKRTTLKGEAWTGQNLDDYFGGIGQGVDFETGEEVEATGGWATVEMRPGQNVLTSLGYGFDDPDDERLVTGARRRNQAVWANVLWDIRPVLTFGVEASYWDTEYLGLEDGSSLRVQTSLIYKFAK